jgi:MFS transporter, YNFM family, putative membrane transport protein
LTAETTRPDAHTDRTTLTMLVVGAFLAVAAMRACDPLLPAFTDVFGVSTGTGASTISSFAVAYGLSQLVYGYLGDHHGKLRVIAMAACASTVGNLVAAFSTDFDVLVAARILSGATAAGIIPMALAWVGDAIPYERRQPELAKIATGTILGGSIGQWLSGTLADLFGWRAVFVLLAVGFLSLGTWLLSHLRSGAATATPPVTGSYLSRIGQVLGAPWARWILLVTLLEGAFAFSATAFIPAHLHHTFGVSLKSAAAIVALFGIGGLLFTVQARVLVPLLGQRGMVALSGVCLLVGFLAIAGARAWWWAVPACLVGGLGFNMLHNTLQTHATQMAPMVRGTAMSLFGTCLFLGQSAGVFAAALVVDRAGFRPIFLVSAIVIGLLAAAFAVSLARRREIPEPT